MVKRPLVTNKESWPSPVAKDRQTACAAHAVSNPSTNKKWHRAYTGSEFSVSFRRTRLRITGYLD